MSTTETDLAAGGADGIAIIGLAGRFPGAASVEALWQNLCAGVEGITFFSREELLAAGVDPRELADPAYVPARGVLAGVELFDAAFFGFTPREATLMDPQQRIFLETAWEALERAGQAPNALPGPVGVFAGAGVNAYLLRNLMSNPEAARSAGLFQTLIHNRADHLATRVAYQLDLHGPAMTVQTACSTSLVAVALACQSLLDYQCDLALAGGVTVGLPQVAGYVHHEGAIESPDGHCRPFDAAAQGTVDGSGVGVVVLRRLAEAVADGDPIVAVIKGWALNNDGREKAGYTTPSLDRQAEVIAMAQAVAGVSAASIGYVEAHGTGTPLGDPIEVAALTRAFRQTTAARGSCALGALKSNLGHLDAAAGVAGLIKTALCLEREAIPPTLHFQVPNPQLDLAASPFFVNAELRPWPRNGQPRRAAVSSFGIGGTNAHLVLEEAPPAAPSTPAAGWQLLQLSAKTAAALEQATSELAGFLAANPGLELADVAHTLRHGRASFAHRRTVVARTPAEAAAALSSLDTAWVASRQQEPVHRPVVFLFPGQGAQYAGMSERLYATEAVYRAALDECCELLRPELGCDLKELLFPAPEAREEAERRLSETRYTQPALFAVEHSLARLWQARGLTPKAMLGHSVGEYVAACLAGVMPLAEALALVAERGRLIQELPPGAMLSVTLPVAEVARQLPSELAVAAVNGPSLTVVSGPEEAVAAFAATLGAAGAVARRLRTSHAFHSPMMDPILPRFTARLRRVPLAPPRLPYLSNLTGTWITAAQATDPAYWAEHLRRTVRFGDGVAELLKEPQAALLEVGPGRTLKTLTRWHRDKAPQQVVETSLPHPSEAGEDDAFFLAAAGRLWLAGVALDPAPRAVGERRRRLALPTYPFERQRYWVEALPEGRVAPRASLAKKANVGDWASVPVWRQTAPRRAERSALAGRRALVLADGSGLGEGLAAWLEGAGARVWLRRVGEEIVLADGEAVGRLLAEVGEGGEASPIVLYLAGLTATASSEVVAASFWGPFQLAKAVTSQGKQPARQRLVLVTTELAAAAGNEATQAERALLLGPAKVLPREVPGASTVVVDVEVPAAGGWDEVVEGVLAEVAERSEEATRVVALRGRRRFVEAYEAVELAAAGAGDGLAVRPSSAVAQSPGPADLPGAQHLPWGAERLGGPPAPDSDSSVPSSPRTYLITGGLGGIGLAVAEWLATREPGVRLVLLGRRGLPPRAEWEAGSAGAGASADRLRRLLALEAAGAELVPLAADLTERAALDAALAEVAGRGWQLAGAFHAAGVPGGGLLRFREPAAAAAVLAPKVEGTRQLEAALLAAGLKPGFLVLFSSLAGVVGRPGQADYAAANAFLDAYAREAGERLGIPVTAVDWGEWLEVGMAASGQAAAAAVVESRPFDHPLLAHCERLASGEEIYSSRMSVETHWVLDEHRLVGHAVIPGVAYIEMVRAALGERAAGRLIEVQDLLFVGPLRVRDGEGRDVRLHLVPDGDGFRFRVESPADAEEGGDGSPRDYALGRVELKAPVDPGRRDLAAIAARLDRVEKVFTDEDREEDLGPRWQCARRIRLGDGESLATLELLPELVGDLAAMAYHPSLMDRAAGVHKDHLFAEEFLPLSYHRLRIHAPVPHRIHSHARYRPDADPGRETLTWDTVVMDDDGRVLVELEGFSQKRINDAAGALRAYAGPQTAAAPATERQEMSAAEGVEVLGRVLAAARWLGPQVAISVCDLAAVIAQAGEVAPERLLAEAAKGRGPSLAGHPRPDLGHAAEPPAGDVEAAIAAAWEELLGIAGIGRHDDYFALGGDSVEAIQIIARLHAAGFEVSPQQFFQYPTIAALAGVLAPAAAAATAAAPRAELPRPSADDLAALARQAGTGELADAFPASPLQQGMLFHQLLAPASGAYTEQLYWTVRGRFEPAAFRAAWRATLDRHPALRAGFLLQRAGEAESALQLIASTAEPAYEELDWSDLPPGEREERFAALLEADRRRGFELLRPPLVRLTEVRLGEARLDGAEDARRILVSYHHLLLDGWSMPLVLADVFAAYRTALAGEPLARAFAGPVPRPYRDYIAWLAAEDRAAARAHWRTVLAGFAEPTPLPGLAARRPAAEEAYRTLKRALPAPATAALAELAKAERLTVNTLLLGAWALTLGRFTGEREVVFGAVVAGRPAGLAGADRMVGLFVNTLPLRVVLDPGRPLLAWLRGIQDAQLAARRFEGSPLVEIQAQSALARRQPLFETLVAFENLPEDAALATAAAALGVSGIARASGRTGYPITVEAFLETELAVHLTHDLARLAPATLDAVADHLLATLVALPAHAAGPLGALPRLAAGERERLEHWGEGGAGGDGSREREGATIVELVAAQVAAAPSRPALVWAGGSLSYGELAARSDRLAAGLLAAGVAPEERVGLALERSPERIVALLGILKAGGAYLPLDLDHPAERLRYLLRDAAASRVIVAGAAPAALAGLARALDYAALVDAPETELPRLDPRQLAYVLYTSGSTGEPKGVAVPHQAVVRLVVAPHYADLGPGEVLCHLAPLAFDASTFEIWGALANGATLALPAPGPLALAAIAGEIGRFGVTTLWLTAGLFHQMVEHHLPALAGVRQLLAGGDVLAPEAVEQALGAPLAGAGRAVINGYGPTENTTFTACARLAPGWTAAAAASPAVPIGRAVGGSRVYLVDRDLALVPVGAPGELVTGGLGLARGYVGRPAATAGRFVPDPFARQPGERLYRTGDRARFLPDGDLDFLGRLDQQLKVRGFRVEPGEVEAALRAQPGVAQALVGLWEAGAGAEAKRLVAWVVPRDGMPAEPAVAATALRAALAAVLPEHLVPTALVWLAELPLTANGKVDRRRLPPPGPAATSGYVAPRSDLEATLAELWQGLLGVERVGIHDNFFDLGGHSLLATRLVAELDERLGVSLGLREVFDAPDLAALADRVVAAEMAQADAAALDRLLAEMEGGRGVGLEEAGG